MKTNIFTTAFILIVNFAYCQKELQLNLFNSNLFETNIEENHYLKEKILPEVFTLEIKNFSTNSEGKFSVNNTTKEMFSKPFNDTDKEIINTNYVAVKNDLIAITNKDFLNDIVFKLMLEQNKIIDETFTYGDRNLEQYRRNFDLENNKLLIDYAINNELEIQIGKSIYPYINKILKTELDKTLQNSLNLLVINF